MELVLKNIEKNNQISKQEFGQVVDLLYGSITISPKDKEKGANACFFNCSS